MKKIALIGQNGQVSTYLQRALADKVELEVIGRDRLDLSQPQGIEAAIEAVNPDLVINPAAYTAVDLAEEEQELAYTINRDAPAELAKVCAANAIPLIHFSTDYVFNGDAKTAYIESDETGPTGVYGASKLAGEQAILASEADALVLRTSWVYSNHGKNFYKTMLALSESRDELSVVADQIGSPTYAGSIAEICSQLALKVVENPKLAKANRGVYHFSCQGETSWCGFAEAIFKANALTNMKVKPCTTADYPTPAKRPAFSVLNNAKLMETFELGLPNWQDALQQCAAEAKA